MKKLIITLVLGAIIGLSITPKKAEAVDPMGFFIGSLAGAIVIGETLLHFGLVDGHIPGDTSAENISAKKAAEFPRP